MAETPAEQPPTQVPERLLYHWIESQLFRVVHADGAWGGISPRGTIHFAFYNERQAIPQLSYRPIQIVGDVIQGGPEKTIEAREGIVREIEVEIIMDYDTAVEFNDWLTNKIAQLKAASSNPQDKK